MDYNLDHRKLYRLPWNPTDNVISWLEPTKECNLYCEGCYSGNRPGYKSLEQIKNDLDVFEKYRNTECVSIAGGDPLVHPEIIEIVRLVAERGLKPIVNTNGLALTKEMLLGLKKAGIKGFTFHVDSRQKRPGWEGKNEIELNDLRQYFADMVAEAGNISVAFNATVYDNKSLEAVPDIVEWGRRNINKVHVLVFITFRACPSEDDFGFYAGDTKIKKDPLPYSSNRGLRVDLTSNEIFKQIRDRFPVLNPAGYLNGTMKLDSMKWLLATALGNPEKYYGSVGPKFMEFVQGVNHFFTGKYLGYTSPKVLKRGKWLLPFAIFDSGWRKIFKCFLIDILKNPLRMFKPLYTQSIMIIQGYDILPDGTDSMCDGCPDMTVHDGRLVWSCRLDEHLNFGGNIRAVPYKKT